jgi:uncharacterized membrane protein
MVPAVVAALLGLYRLGDKSFWLDEAFSSSIIRLPTSDLLVYLWRNEQHESLYHLILQPWSSLGYDETTARLLSVVIGVVGVLTTYAIGRRYGVALPAALLVAVSPFFIHYEQEARTYTLLVAWSAISTLAYLRLIERPGRLRAAVYVAAAAALAYVHALSAWVIVAHALATIFFVAPPMRRRLLALYIPVLIAWLPLFRFLVINHGRAGWIEPATLGTIVQGLVTLSGGAALAIALAILIPLGMRRDLPTLWLFVPIGGILAMSLVIQPLWVDRYLLGTLPALAIVTARALNTRPQRWAILTALVALSLFGVNNWYVNGVKDDWRGATAYVEARAQPTDGVIIWPNYYRLPFAYYTAVGEPLYPSTPWSTLYVPGWGLSIDLPPDVHNERIWLVRNVQFEPSPEIAQLLEHYQTVEKHVFGVTQPEIDLLVRR